MVLDVGSYFQGALRRKKGNQTFFSTIEMNIKKKNTLLCLGIDPRESELENFFKEYYVNESYIESMKDISRDEVETYPAYLPLLQQRNYDNKSCRILNKESNDLLEVNEYIYLTMEVIYSYCAYLVNKCKDRICCVKVNSAFFEQYHVQGISALRNFISCTGRDMPIILDSKRGDIGSSSAAYAHSAFSVLNADAITVCPYLGRESVEPFCDCKDKNIWGDVGVFVVCKTSNSGSNDIQCRLVENDCSLFESVAELFLKQFRYSKQIALVIGANDTIALRTIRSNFKDVFILAPGVGAQKADLCAALENGLRKDGSGMIIPVARGISEAKDVAEAAHIFSDAINKVRKSMIN